MSVNRSLVLTSCLLLVAVAASAERPECPPTKGGACFVDISDMGEVGFLTDPNDGDTVVVGPFDENNDFIRFPPRGNRVRLHQIDREIGLFVCPGDPGCANGPTLFGTAHVSANVSVLSSGELSCPTSIMVHGTAADGGGAEFDVRAALVLTPSKKAPGGCKVAQGEVVISPN